MDESANMSEVLTTPVAEVPDEAINLFGCGSVHKVLPGRSKMRVSLSFWAWLDSPSERKVGVMARVEQRRTRVARAAVLREAATLFINNGYVTTSIAQIAARSHVPEATIYRLYSNKLGILRATMDVAIAGDDSPEPVAARPEALRARTSPDPLGKIEAFVKIMVSINQRISALYWVVFNAADSDDGARALLRDLDDQRSRGQGHLAAALEEASALAPGVNRSDAEDVIHALMSPETFRLLVTERSWQTERYRAWLTKLLADQLLGPNR